MSLRKKKILSQMGEFMRRYQRKAQGGKNEPNDRGYSRKLQQKLKRMKPEQLDELLHGEEDNDMPAASAPRSPEKEKSSVTSTGGRQGVRRGIENFGSLCAPNTIVSVSSRLTF
jgi:hypothetical protein